MLTDFSTLFNATLTWPMPDNADPLSGWSSKTIHETSGGPAKPDIYGKHFTYLGTMLRAFLPRLPCQQRFSFRMFHVDACALHDYLETGSYSRIEVIEKKQVFCYLNITNSHTCCRFPISWTMDFRESIGLSMHDSSAPESTHQPSRNSDHLVHECCGRNQIRNRKGFSPECTGPNNQACSRIPICLPDVAHSYQSRHIQSAVCSGRRREP